MFKTFTGALLKAVDRGNRAISTVLHASCIVFVPAAFQVLFTGAMIAYNCGLEYCGLLFAFTGAYAKFSIVLDLTYIFMTMMPLTHRL